MDDEQIEKKKKKKKKKTKELGYSVPLSISFDRRILNIQRKPMIQNATANCLEECVR
jgi:hypothetical protein